MNSADGKGSKIVVTMDGAIGETTPLFTHPLKGITELTLDMKGVTYISSVGVKNWIIWTLKVPASCKVKMFSCPYVIVSQASNVIGFMIPQMRIESFCAPYVCSACDFDGLHLVTNGVDYAYSTETTPKMIKLPENLPCPKCKEPKFSHDLLIEKTFKFLT